ncbi:hypothetical protein MKEN_01419900 [Mycena kentingensis (nom. inval.)]|nr:hypothetical protein MKEN_01419900 [Mycena kentingensis (nom. inval.)]
MATRHAQYYMRLVYLEVENCLFAVPSHQFTHNSGFFAETLSSPPTGNDIGEGWHESCPLNLEGVSVSDFESLLKVLYPIASVPQTPVLSPEEWLSVLSLASKWLFVHPRKLAIDQLSAYAASCDPVQRVLLGRKHDVSAWIRSGYSELAHRKTSISTQEASQLGLETALTIFRLREAAIDYLGIKNLYADVQIEAAFAQELAEDDDAPDLSLDPPVSAVCDGAKEVPPAEKSQPIAEPKVASTKIEDLSGSCRLLANTSHSNSTPVRQAEVVFGVTTPLGSSSIPSVATSSRVYSASSTASFGIFPSSFYTQTLHEGGKVPRPPNAFILFRTDHARLHHNPLTRKARLRGKRPDGSPPITVSRRAADAWARLSDEERAHYARLAEIAKQRHAEMFPGYQYRPERKKARARAAAAAAVEAAAPKMVRTRARARAAAASPPPVPPAEVSPTPPRPLLPRMALPLVAASPLTAPQQQNAAPNPWSHLPPYLSPSPSESSLANWNGNAHLQLHAPPAVSYTHAPYAFGASYPWLPPLPTPPAFAFPDPSLQQMHWQTQTQAQEETIFAAYTHTSETDFLVG